MTVGIARYRYRMTVFKWIEPSDEAVIAMVAIAWIESASIREPSDRDRVALMSQRRNLLRRSCASDLNLTVAINFESPPIANDLDRYNSRSNGPDHLT